MTAKAAVWIFLPGQTVPVHCGRLSVLPAGFIEFRYAASYLGRDDAMPLHPLTLGLSQAGYAGRREQALPPAIVDAAPDAWGRRAIEYRSGSPAPDELDYLLAGAGHRAGALHFQAGESEYRPVELPAVSIRDLAQAAALLEQNAPLPPELDDALLHGTSIGGARPKAAIADGSGHWIAKFSSRTDRYDVVRFEYATMKLAAQCGIDVPEVRLIEVADRQALLVRRFDRVPKGSDYSRRLLLSALSLLQLDDTEARLAGYPDFAEVLRQWSREPLNDCKQLFRRMLFNMLVGNTDDHAKNHAAFWDGRRLALTPAYDLMPMPRSGQEGRQAMRVGEHGPAATLTNACSEASRFGLLAEEAQEIVSQLRDCFADWREQFAAAGLGAREYERLAGTVIDSPAVLR
jgi:serine/threonine-protein kinase HipA